MLIKVNTSTHEADGIIQNMPLEAMIRDYVSARISSPEVITVEMDYCPDDPEVTIDYSTLEEHFDRHLGQSYTRSLTDNSGCSMGRANRSWLSPQRVTEIVHDVLANAGVTIVGEAQEDEDTE